jgi:tRNA/tmRNA/rRNA uracil-C5-methylase (TrmA/RlmC/RlmD family)
MMKNNMKQTALEWIFNEMERLRVNAKINNMDDYKFIIRSAEIFEQAKEMEKQQLESLKDFDTWKEWKNKLMSN